jgi:hypothetical protein
MLEDFDVLLFNAAHVNHGMAGVMLVKPGKRLAWGHADHRPIHRYDRGRLPTELDGGVVFAMWGL